VAAAAPNILFWNASKPGAIGGFFVPADGSIDIGSGSNQTANPMEGLSF
jgi:hypothetical protein